MKNILAIAALTSVLAACNLGESVADAPALASTRDSVDLSGWKTDSANGKSFAKTPSMSAIIPYGGKAFVVLQRLDSAWTNSHRSVVVVIDPTTRHTEASIALPVSNPTSYTVIGSMLYLACTGGYGVNDGGVVAVDMAARTAKLSVSDADLGGDAAGIQVSGTKGYASVMSWPKIWVRPFDLASGKVDSTIPGIDSVGATLVVDGALWIGLARSAQPSLVRYDLATRTLHDTIALRLEPRDLRLTSDGRIVALQGQYGVGGGLGAVDFVDRSTKALTNLRTMSTSDWAMQVRDGGIYLFDRTSGVATLYGGSKLTTPILDENVGAGSNPYDAAKFGTETWVVRFGANSLLILK